MQNGEPKDLGGKIGDAVSQTYRSHHLRRTKAKPHYRGDLNLSL